MATKGINAKKLIEHFGGITDAHAALCAAGAVITRKAVAKWAERGSIPSAHLLTLIEIARKHGKPVDLAKFTTTTTTQNTKK